MNVPANFPCTVYHKFSVNITNETEGSFNDFSDMYKIMLEFKNIIKWKMKYIKFFENISLCDFLKLIFLTVPYFLNELQAKVSFFDHQLFDCLSVSFSHSKLSF